MRALTVKPGTANSIQLEDVPPPPTTDGAVLVRALALGICGTDREIISGDYGWAPPGAQRLIIGHESLGRVETAPADSGFSPGELVVGIVRRPDPVPCPDCAVGEWDMCRNGQYTERGIKQTTATARSGGGSSPSSCQGRPGTGQTRRAAGTGQRSGQGVGAHRADRRARCGLVPARGSHHRRRAGRPAGGVDGQAARLDVHILDRTEEARSPSWRAISALHTTPAIRSRSSPTS